MSSGLQSGLQAKQKAPILNESAPFLHGAGNGNRTTIFIHRRCKNQMFLLKAHRFFWKGLHIFAGPFYFLQKYVGPKVGPTGWPFGWRFQSDHPMFFRPARSGAGAYCSPVGLLDGLRGGICQLCPLALHLMLVHSERVHVLAVAHEHLQLPLCELPGLHADKSMPKLI